MSRHSCLYVGEVSHRRLEPVRNSFGYRLFMMYLDLSELDEVLGGRLLWSHRRPAAAWFRRADYLGDPRHPLPDAVKDAVESMTGRRPEGPIRVLTHLRYFGYCFNPVSVYYCFEPSGERVEAILAEITNTPWNERYRYVLHRDHCDVEDGVLRKRFRKEFHVSPFMGMAYTYDWRFTEPGDRLVVHMENLRGAGKTFDATLSLRRQEIGGRALDLALLRYPFMTMKVIAAIHYQALRLWLKRCPFHPHPGRRSNPDPEAP